MSNNKKSSDLPWYKEGLRFKCTECGQCCTGSPGYVWLTHNEMETIANHLKITLNEFKKKYTRQKNGRFSLLEKSHQNFDCIFLEGMKCQIYNVRPKQCRTFPWWKNILKSRKDWEKTAQYCEGINDKAPLITYDEISEQLNE